MHIYPPITRKRSMRYTSSLRELPAICLPHQDGGIPLSAFPIGTTINLPACSSHCPLTAERQAGKLWTPISKSSVWPDSESNPEFTAQETDALHHSAILVVFPSGPFYPLVVVKWFSNNCGTNLRNLQNCLRNAQLCLIRNKHCAIGQKFSLKRNANSAIDQKFSLKRNANCAGNKKKKWNATQISQLVKVYLKRNSNFAIAKLFAERSAVV